MSSGFVSYAQNFEDVMLWRALSHVDCGFYIDIGAHHPTIDSVSLAFYERGWTGIDVEPVPDCAALLREHRPKNEVVEMALSNNTGKLSLTVVPETGLSTASSALAATMAEDSEKYHDLKVLEVDQCRLSDLAEFYAGRSVHWMKIDVEGFEQQVLEGWDPTILRPWVLVVEATVPNSDQSSHECWESIVLDAGYQCVYKDGLNRFYLAAEHIQLANAFEYPPNVFDDIRLRPHSAMLQDLAAEHMRDIRKRVANYQRQVLALQHFQARYEAVIQSASWRFTAPLRLIVDWALRILTFKDRWLEIKGWKARIRALRHLRALIRSSKPSSAKTPNELELSPEGRVWLKKLEVLSVRSTDSH